MVELYENTSGERIGLIESSELQFLTDELGEASSKDYDYRIDTDTLRTLEDKNCPKILLAILKNALKDQKTMDIRWRHV
jgi:hypothetical protein